VATAQIRIEAQVQQALAGLDQVNNKLDQITRATTTTSRAMSGLKTQTDLSARAFQALAGAVSVGALINLADSATLVNNKLRSVTGSTAEASAAFKEVARIAQISGQRFEAIGDLYQKVALQSKNLGLSQTEVARIVENVSKGLTKYGASAQQAASFTYQFSQALGRGTLKYEDFRDMLEASPAMVANIARQFSMTTSEFLRAVQAGQLSSEQLALAMNNMGRDVDLTGFQRTVGQSLENVRTNFIILADEFERSTGLFAGIAKALELLAKNLDTAAVAAGIFLSVFAAKKIYDIATAAATLNTVLGKNPLLKVAILAATAGAALFQMAKGNEEVDAAQKKVADSAEKVRGIIDARAKSEAELNKEQMAGLEGYFRKLDAQRKAAGLSGEELAIQKAINEAAQALKITEDQMTQAVKNRVTERAREIYQQEQAKKNAEIIAKAEQQRTTTLKQATQQLDDQLEIGKLTADQQEIERAVRQVNRDLVKEIRDDSGKLLGYTKGLSQEEEKILRTKLQQIQQDRLAVALAEQRALLAGRAVPQSREQQIQTATGVIRRIDPRASQESQYDTERAAIEASVDNEQKRNQLLEKLRREHADRMHELSKQQAQAELKQAGVTNQGILDAVSKSQDNIRMMQEGGIKAVMGGIDQMGYIFNQLGAYNKRAFEAAKAFNIANAVMNTYLGATKALAMYPPPFNFIAAAAVVASGLAQVAAIRSQSFSGRQLGGPVMGGQTYMVGENGPELFTPNTTGSIVRNGDLGGGTPVIVNFQITANDTTGFDQLLNSRKGIIQQIISDAMLEKGRRSLV
jgi:tape measure domain-containing protein